MRMDASLQARQEMRMRLAPQIIQSIEILQLPLLELRERIEQELLENPVLEQESATLEDEEEQAQAEPEGQEESPVEPPQEGQPAEAKAEEAAAQPPEAADEVDDYDAEPVDEVTVEESGTAEQFERCDELEDYYAEFEDVGYTRRYSSEEPDEKREAFENSPAPEPTLEEHLGRQLAEQELDETVRRVCENIIANLDERGYLAYPLEEIVASMDMAVSPEQAEEALRVVQSFEPPGVGARSLEECLLLQLDPREPDYEFLRTLIREHFQDILQNRLPKVAQAMGCSLDELKAAVEKIGKLNPKPGSLFSSERPPYVVPDLRVEEVDGEFVVMLEDSWLPPLRISPFYQRKLRSGDLDPKGREYLRRKLQSAHGLISAIEQRRSTLYNVATEIVKAQREFFEKGSLYLKPLKMQEIADRAGVHVSTVSRAISDKYVQTPQGLFSLKHFFTGGLQKDDGEVESWEVVRQKLTDIVEHEDKRNPLSDQEIADRLKAQGIEIARRTVSKYRKSLGIPSSRLRKRY